jgi:hypothetical protein
VKRTAYRSLLGAAIATGLVAALLPRLSPWPVSATVVGTLTGIACGLAFAAVLVWQMPDSCDAAPLALRRRYAREFFPAMIGYIVAVFVSLWLLKRVDEPLLRAALALLPVAPIALVLRSVIRYIRDVDEMQQRIELEATSLATALVSLLYLAGGFLQTAKVIELRAGMTMLMVFPLICAVYGIAKIFVVRRYR